MYNIQYILHSTFNIIIIIMVNVVYIILYGWFDWDMYVSIVGSPGMVVRPPLVLSALAEIFAKLVMFASRVAGEGIDRESKFTNVQYLNT